MFKVRPFVVGNLRYDTSAASLDLVDDGEGIIRDYLLNGLGWTLGVPVALNNYVWEADYAFGTIGGLSSCG